MDEEYIRFNIGDMVRDIFIIPHGDEPETLGIITKVDVDFFKKEHDHPIVPHRRRNKDQVHVSWVTGELAGRQECVPEWFLRLVSPGGKGNKPTIYMQQDEEE